MQDDVSWFYKLGCMFRDTIYLADIPPMYRNAYRLYHHPRRDKARRMAFRGYVLVDSRKQLNGITKVLESVFYPFQESQSTGGARTGGSVRGITTDNELKELVNDCKMPENPGTYTVRAMTYLKRHGLQPFACQYLVYDEKLNIATELDILAVDTTVLPDKNGIYNNVVNIQLKTGFNNNYEKGTNYLRSPYVSDSKLALVNTTHRNIHHLQNMVEHMIVMINYDELLRESVVVVLSEICLPDKETISHNAMYRIPKHIERLKIDVYRNLLSRLSHDETEEATKAFSDEAMKKQIKKTFL